MKRYKWWFWIPRNVYAYEFVFERPVTLKHAKQYVRDWLKVKRLPRGYGCWPGDH